MVSEADEPLKHLDKERTRLERLLEADAGWRALVQLDAREAEGRPLAAVDAAALRSAIEGRLAGNRYFLALRKVSEAMALLVEPVPARPQRPVPARSPLPASASPAATAVSHPGQPPRAVTIAGISARATPLGPVPPPAVPTEAPADDLTRIRGVDRALAAHLLEHGVRTFSDVAGWRADDVRRITGLLALGGRIARENWIEQAAMLAPRPTPAPCTATPDVAPAPAAVSAGEPEARPDVAPPAVTAPAGPPAHAPAPADRSGRAVAALVAEAARRILATASPPALPPGIATPVAEPCAAAAAVATPDPVPVPLSTDPPPADDLTDIDGLDAAAVAVLAGLGIDGFSALARLSATDAGRIRAATASGAPRLGHWIEQAAILAGGGSTRHLRARAELAGLAVVPPPDPALCRADPELALCLTGLAASDRPVAASPEAPTGPLPAPAASVPAAPAAAAPVPRTPLAIVVLPPLRMPESDPPAPVPDQVPVEPGAAAEADLGDLYDTLEFSVAEADVLIVPPALFPAAAADPEDTDDVRPAHPSRPFIPAAGPGTLNARLRRAGSDEDFDGARYAAYRTAVEEASVEIVRRGGPAAAAASAGGRSVAGFAQAGPAAAGPAETRAAETLPAGPGPSEQGVATVRRFLKALTGQSR